MAYIINSPQTVLGTGISPGQINFSDGTNAVQVKAPTTLAGNVNFVLPDAAGTTGQFLQWNASGNTQWVTGSSFPNTDVWYITDQKTTGTNGGTFTSGSWQTRNLNTLTKPSGTGTDITVSSNILSIATGTYKVLITAPGMRVSSHKSRLRNTTDGVTELVGSSANIASSTTTGTVSVILGILVVASGPKNYTVEHQCATTRNTDGFGLAAGFSEVEIYTSCVFEKIV